jgi:hypothetical protein
MIGKGLSAIIAVVYVVVAYAADGGEAAIACTIYLILPLACIWFSEEMGEFTGIMRGHLVTSTSPGCAVAGMGWILLLLPVVVGLYFMSKG